MNKIELIGYLGACATTFTLLPQMIQTIQTKDTSGLSLTTYIIGKSVLHEDPYTITPGLSLGYRDIS